MSAAYTDGQMKAGLVAAVKSWQDRVDQAERGEDVETAKIAIFALDQHELDVLACALSVIDPEDQRPRDVRDALLASVEVWLDEHVEVIPLPEDGAPES